jgi:hypothetical protein
MVDHLDAVLLELKATGTIVVTDRRTPMPPTPD